MKRPFRDSSEKITRAEEHLRSLDEATTAYFAGHWYNCSYTASTGLQLTVIGSPKRFQTILGDAIHNLRAALDIAAVEAVSRSRGNPDKVYFPFTKKGNDFESMLKQKNFHRAARPYQEIVRAARPYADGNLLLCAINELDIEDKHISLIPNMANMKTPAIRVKTDQNGNPLGFAEGKLALELEPGSKPQVSFVFPSTCLVRGCEVTKTAKEMALEARSIIEKFAAVA
jgi:hypothetical protein